MKLLEPSGKKGGRIKSVEALAEQREVEKSYSTQLLELFEKTGIKNLYLGNESLVLAKAANPEVLRLQENPSGHARSIVNQASQPNPGISIDRLGRARLFDPSISFPINYPRGAAEEVAHVSKPGDELRSLSAGALACVGFPDQKRAIQAVLRDAYPRILDKIMQGFHAGFSIGESATREVRLPALARLLGLVSDDQIATFNDKNLARWKNMFKESLGQFDGPIITDKVWLENEINLALALEVLEAARAFITEDGKPVLVRKGSLGTAMPALPERPLT